MNELALCRRSSAASRVRGEARVDEMNDSGGSESTFDDIEPAPDLEDGGGDEDIPFLPSLKDSRLQKDFRNFKGIGRGAFGDVIRVWEKF